MRFITCNVEYRFFCFFCEFLINFSQLPCYRSLPLLSRDRSRTQCNPKPLNWFCWQLLLVGVFILNWINPALKEVPREIVIRKGSCDSMTVLQYPIV